MPGKDDRRDMRPWTAIPQYNHYGNSGQPRGPHIVSLLTDVRCTLISASVCGIECILYTWDYHTALSVYNALRVLPILSDEIMTFKALILVHKVIQEGHACAIKEGQNQIGWLETCSRTMGSEGARGEPAIFCLCSNMPSP